MWPAIAHLLHVPRRAHKAVTAMGKLCAALYSIYHKPSTLKCAKVARIFEEEICPCLRSPYLWRAWVLCKSNIVRTLLGSTWGKCWRVGVVFPWDHGGVPTNGSLSASAAVDVAVHDTKIFFPPVFPKLPDMSNGRFPHPDSALARAEPGFGWLTNITAGYLFERTLYIWKRKRAGATSTGQTVFPWERTPLSFSDWQGWKVASIGLGTDGKMTFDAHQVQRLLETWSHRGLETVAPRGINTHGQSYGPKFWFKNQDEIDPDWHPVEGVQLTPASVRKVGGTISPGGNKKRLQGVIGELKVDESERPEKKQRRTMGAGASESASAAVALPSAPPAESMGIEAVVDESLHVLPSVIKQESQDEMMAPTAGLAAAAGGVPVCDAL